MAARRPRRRAPTYERELYHAFNVVDARERQLLELVRFEMPDGSPEWVWPQEQSGPALAYARRVLDERYGPVPA